jgi:hypothetical protein
METSHPLGAGAKPAKPRLGDRTLDPHLQNLAVVLERLWLFYEAMRHGKPVANGELFLTQIGTALSQSARHRSADSYPHSAKCKLLLNKR